LVEYGCILSLQGAKKMDFETRRDRLITAAVRDSDAGVRSMADVLDEFWTQYRARFPESEASAPEEAMAVAVA
jgi:hypothetical protein